ncbi:MAG TPA: YdcF family protein [Candidatus Saccharimonadales bacterium]|nr:YdcF family protein [Candidatus Saccharimonadales bacterium]
MSRLRVLLWTVIVTVLLGTSTATIFLFGVGHWLIQEDRLAPATAIVVLSGYTPDRALEAAQLYDDGYAPEIWLTHPGGRVDALADLGIRYPSEDDVNTRVLRRVGVPAKAIHVLETPIANTDDELNVISSNLQARGGHCVIIVTSKSHTRRVHLLWDKYYSARGQAMIHAVSADSFQASRWWMYSGSINQVVHEVMGIANAWAGMPVQAIPLPNSAVVAEGKSSPEHIAAD